ncbi:mitochondrial carrier [Dendrothele bispora CBS 962.96]|uniref:Mitochondrial carrier n=1 Tax=Dendrothele bispora (strain CBS 962.96) TaxID=1314807 RepID=A0A4S8MEY7_DENBC|nr:mitochondrial carrier [Dendrothele bispora CBS 962.96]
MFLSLPYLAVTSLMYAPFTTTMVRYRANYAPKNPPQTSNRNSGSTTGNNTEVQTGDDVGSVIEVNGYFAMMNRINKIEGLSGFLKGFVPSILYGFFAIIRGVLLRYLIGSGLEEGSNEFRFNSWYWTINHFVWGVIVLPFDIIINRAICTPYLLSFTQSPSIALSVLLSPSERKRPWKLYRSDLLTTVMISFSLFLLVRWLNIDGTMSSDSSGEEDKEMRVFQMNRLHLYAASIILRNLTRIPLDVVSTRLMLQRYRDGSTQSSLPEGEEPNASQLGLRKYSAYAKVIGVRSQSNPYTSLYDCIIKMKREEGWKVFYRGFWLSVLSSFSWIFIVTVFSSWRSPSSD